MNIEARRDNSVSKLIQYFCLQSEKKTIHAKNGLGRNERGYSPSVSQMGLQLD